MSAPSRHALGDPRISWTVLMTAQVRAGYDADEAMARADALAEAQGWPRPGPLEVTLHTSRITLAADHRHLDGQAMLTALGFLLGRPIRSKARGVDADRRRSGLVRSGIRRSAEILTRPGAIFPATSDSPTAEDALACLRLGRRVTTSELVVAATAVLSARTAGPISIAIGVAQPSEEGRIGDNSGFLRIRDARSLSRSEVSQLLRTADLQPGADTATGMVGRLAAIATRHLADRLGSTLLISHLGDVDTDAVSDLAFYPVTGGPSGVSLGAATVGGLTTITLRARGTRHNADGLQRVLEAIAVELGD